MSNDDLDTLRPEVRGLGPCKMCGATDYSMSFGGPDICPACDCGVNPDVTRLKRELAEARAELLRLAGVEAELAAAQNTVAAQQGTMGALKRNLALAEGELAALKARIAGSRHAFLGPNMDRITFLADEIGPNGKYALVKVED